MMLSSASSGLAMTSSGVTTIIERFHTFENKIAALIELYRPATGTAELNRLSDFSDQPVADKRPGDKIAFADTLADFPGAAGKITPVDAFLQCFKKFLRFADTAGIARDARAKLGSGIGGRTAQPAAVLVSSWLFDHVSHSKIH